SKTHPRRLHGCPTHRRFDPERVVPNARSRHGGRTMNSKSPRRRPMNRRIFLRGVGGATLAAPFLSSLEQRPLMAQDAPPDPKRLVIFYTNNGCLTNRWFPDIGGSDGA